MPYTLEFGLTRITFLDLAPRKNSNDVGKSPDKNPNHAHYLEKLIFPPTEKLECAPLWIEKSPDSLYVGECPIYKVKFRLQKKAKGWNCIITIGYEKFFGFSRNSKESALHTTWTSAAIERERYSLDISHTLNWGNFKHEFPMTDIVHAAIEPSQNMVRYHVELHKESHQPLGIVGRAVEKQFQAPSKIRDTLSPAKLKQIEDAWQAEREESNSNRI